VPGELCPPSLAWPCHGDPFAPIEVLRPPAGGAGWDPRPRAKGGDSSSGTCRESGLPPVAALPARRRCCLAALQGLKCSSSRLGFTTRRAQSPQLPWDKPSLSPARTASRLSGDSQIVTQIQSEQLVTCCRGAEGWVLSYPHPGELSFCACRDGADFWRGLWRCSGSQPPARWLLALRGHKGAHLGAQGGCWQGAKPRFWVQPGCESSAQRPETGPPHAYPAVTRWHSHGLAAAARLGTVWVTRGSRAGAGQSGCQGIFWAPGAGTHSVPMS